MNDEGINFLAGIVKEEFQKVNQRFDQVDARLDQVDARLDRIEQKVDVLRYDIYGETVSLTA